MELNSDQVRCLDEIISFLLSENTNVHLLTGCAGTGKTYLLRHLVDKLKQSSGSLRKYGENTYITATTNEAVSCVQQVFTNAHATTVYSLFKYRIFDDYKTGKRSLTQRGYVDMPNFSFVIIDEASYLQEYILENLRAKYGYIKFLLVGDKYQLLPVNSVSAISKWKYGTSELNEVMRNEGLILKTSHNFKRVLDGEELLPIEADQESIIELSSADFCNKLFEHYSDINKPALDTKYICWQNKQSIKVNNAVRKHLGVTKKPFILKQGEIVINNNHYTKDSMIIHNNFVGKIDDVSSTSESEDYYSVSLVGKSGFHSVPINIDNHKKRLNILSKGNKWRDFFKLQDSVLDLRAGYAGTTHKAQGKTYKNVFIDLIDMDKCTNKETLARLMYVAVSRASEKVYIRR